LFQTNVTIKETFVIVQFLKKVIDSLLSNSVKNMAHRTHRNVFFFHNEEHFVHLKDCMDFKGSPCQ